MNNNEIKNINRLKRYIDILSIITVVITALLIIFLTICEIFAFGEASAVINIVISILALSTSLVSFISYIIYLIINKKLKIKEKIDLQYLINCFVLLVLAATFFLK